MNNLVRYLKLSLILACFTAAQVKAEVTYIHTDFSGSPAVLTNEAGEVISRSHYKPFGESIEGIQQDIEYTGHQHDAELGLTYMQARYYDPIIGRFYSNDPVGFRDIYSFNRYVYANNNPYKFVDPSGGSNVLAYTPYQQGAFSHTTGNLRLTTAQQMAGAELIVRSTPVGRGASVAKLLVGAMLTTSGEAEAPDNDTGQSTSESKGQTKPEVGSCPDCGGSTSNKPGKIASQHGIKTKEAKDKIHGLKGEANISGNPDVEVCNDCGEVFPQTPDGGLGDSIGNIDEDFN